MDSPRSSQSHAEQDFAGKTVTASLFHYLIKEGVGDHQGFEVARESSERVPTRSNYRAAFSKYDVTQWAAGGMGLPCLNLED